MKVYAVFEILRNSSFVVHQFRGVFRNRADAEKETRKTDNDYKIIETVLN